MSDDPIPYYDHLLQPDEVDALARRVADQMTVRGITDLRFYMRSVEDDPDVRPYRDAMEEACRLAEVKMGARTL
jgi:hypothetical protein